jgi:hypothetical protein
MAILSPEDNSILSRKEIFFNNEVIDQNINKTVKELEIADNRLIHTATCSGSAKKENNLPRTIKNGAPGG